MNYKNIVLGLSVILLTSCVSSKKFKALQSQNTSSNTKLADCLKGNSALQQENTQLKAKLSQLTADSTQLESLLSQLKISSQNVKDSLIAENKNFQQIITDCSQKIEQIKNKSSKEVQSLITSLEQMQKDLDEREQKLQNFDKELASTNNQSSELKKKLSEALLSYSELGLSVSQKDGNVLVSLSNELLYKLGKTEIDKKGKDALKELCKILNQVEDITIMVEGHTDDIPVTNLGEMKDNWDLSVMRSTEVIRFMTKECKVNPKKIVAAGRGEYFPIQEGKENRAKNRRTEIILIPNLKKIFQLIEK